MNALRPIRLMFPALLAVAAAPLAGAQPAKERLLAPLNAAAPAGALVYDSAFSGYQQDPEITVADWKKTNAAVTNTAGRGAHAGPGMNQATEADPHAGHEMNQATEADPHAGHAMQAKKPATATDAAHQHHE